MHVLIVTKDIGAFNVAFPIFRGLRNLGHRVLVAAEGLSIAKWREVDDFNLAMEGAVDFRQGDPTPHDLASWLKSCAINVVVATTSWPINLENRMAVAANELGIPVVLIEDIIGAHSRFAALPQLILTLSGLAKQIVLDRGQFPSSTLIEVIGSPALSNLKAPTDEERLQVASVRPQHGHVALVVGHGPSTTSMLEMFLSCLRETKEKVRVIHRAHPKYEIAPDWDFLLRQWENEHPGSVVWKFSSPINAPSTDTLAQLCDFTVSTFSTTLMVAAQARRVPVSICTPETVQVMQERTGLNFYPLARVGAGLKVSHPFNLVGLWGSRINELATAQHRYAQTAPWSAEAAAVAIERVVLR